MCHKELGDFFSRKAESTHYLKIFQSLVQSDRNYAGVEAYFLPHWDNFPLSKPFPFYATYLVRISGLFHDVNFRDLDTAYEPMGIRL
jgi:hypothetical protein